ncbi:uncharacterized protein BROUX77_001951 [Berkeleyomyces rouxiae]|uniref:uncharacterized protein n=1 Tax=Berkeleyomyces rouxiae TaxID=2035830 RepID=UPI003B7B2BDE
MALVSELATHGSEFWLFGYGSLIWKPPPHFDQRVSGYVTGYVRRFWQASEDHRGTPEAPGRVVTLIERAYWDQLGDTHHAAPERVWGVAYRIKSDRVAEVKEYLDIREINGYSVHHQMFQPADPDAAPIRTLVYIGTPDNEQFTGPQDPRELASHIARSKGPSGLNSEYLLELNTALEALGAGSSDAHISDLSQRVAKLLKAEVGQESAIML